MIKKYLDYIKEAGEFENYDNVLNNDADVEPSDNKYTELKDEIKSLIEDTIDNSGGEYNTFVESFIKNPEDTKIEGLINDSDIYDFYLKYRNDIDELLNDVKYFDEIPSELNVAGLYDYIIKGTERAVLECVKLMGEVNTNEGVKKFWN